MHLAYRKTCLFFFIGIFRQIKQFSFILPLFPALHCLWDSKAISHFVEKKEALMCSNPKIIFSLSIRDILWVNNKKRYSWNPGYWNKSSKHEVLKFYVKSSSYFKPSIGKMLEWAYSLIQFIWFSNLSGEIMRIPDNNTISPREVSQEDLWSTEMSRALVLQ